MSHISLNTQETFDLARYMVLPVPDGEFLPLKDPFSLAAEGSFNQANVMIGCLSEEGNIGVSMLKGERVDVEAYREHMAIWQMSDPIVQDMAAVVFGSDELVRRVGSSS